MSIAGEDRTENDDTTVGTEPRIKEEHEESSVTMGTGNDESDEGTVIASKSRSLVDEVLTDGEN